MNIDKNSKVAVYSRKSREDPDTEDTLLKHREQLKALLTRYSFTDVEWFEEVVSSDSIDNRPIFLDYCLESDQVNSTLYV